MYAIVRLFLAWSVVTASVVHAAEIAVRKYSPAVMVDGLVPVGSGSGLVIGEGLVLTNGHVVVDENGMPYAGFRVLVGPDYTKRFDACVEWVCESHDLALLRTSSDVKSLGLLVLDGVPPLGTQVNTYAFPLGNEFGIGLTSTGGQITRHPVVATPDESNYDIKTSCWHDAVSAGGSSGGPLLTSRNILVGVHWGSLKNDKSHGNGFAVPGDVIAGFLRKSDAAKSVQFVDVAGLENSKSTIDPKASSVFIEVLASPLP
ncbi:MAG: S1C family serine protease [Pirellulales bacterium]